METNVSLDETGEFQESVLSLVSKTMRNTNANEEFLPDVVGRLIIFPSNIDHYRLRFELRKIEFGPGYYLSTALEQVEILLLPGTELLTVPHLKIR